MPEIEKPTTDTSIELPDLQDEVLNEETLSQLFADLASFAEIHEIRIKGGARKNADSQTVDLSESHRLLRSREIHGVQILYTHDQIRWFDTLLQNPNGWRLIRMKALSPDTPC